MIKTRISEKIVALLVLLFLLAYVGHQFYRYYFRPIQTETAFQYSMSQNIQAEGIAIRSETVIEQRSTGVESSTFADGTRVAKGQAVAEFYANSGGDEKQQRLKALEREINDLTEAQNPAVSNFNNADSINRDIKDQLGSIALMSKTGRYDGMSDVRPGLVSLINKKQIAVGREQSYQSRIDLLLQQYNQLKEGIETTNVDVATAPVSGYFVGQVDGLESTLTPGAVKDFTVDDFRELIQEDDGERPGLVGKIVDSSNWYFAVLVPKEELPWIKAGRDVTIRFDVMDDPIPATVERVIEENFDDDMVLLLRSNYVNGDVLSIRRARIILAVEQLNGLRISTSSLRIVDDVRGVYVLDKKTVRFREVDPVYEEAGFLISKESIDPKSNTVQLYDQIITKGLDLYDGKVID